MRQAMHAYYQGERTIAKLCYSDLPADRELYEALYQFAKGTFQGQRQRLAPGGRAEIELSLALNEPAGRYTVSTADVLSGAIGQTHFEVTRR